MRRLPERAGLEEGGSRESVQGGGDRNIELVN